MKYFLLAILWAGTCLADTPSVDGIIITGTTGNVPTLTGTNTLTNKTLTAPVINSPTGIVKANVGLGSVDNTSDAAKPVSTAAATALALKQNSSNAATLDTNQTITGNKIFSGALSLPGGTTIGGTALGSSAFLAIDVDGTLGANSNTRVASQQAIKTYVDAHTGSVTSISVANANGVSAIVTNPTTTPLLTVSLGDITPTKVTNSGVSVLAPNALAGTVINVGKAINTKSIAAPTTFTFSSTPAAGTFFSLELTETSGTARVITIPSSFSLTHNATVTSFTIGASSKLFLTWYYNGSTYNLYNEPLGTAAALNIRTGTSGAMTAGTVTVSDTATTATTRYFLSTRTLGTITAPAAYRVSTRTVGTSFVITSASASDTSTVDFVAVD